MPEPDNGATNGVMSLYSEPEVPDLTEAQIGALQELGDHAETGIKKASDQNVDIRTTLAILIMRLVGANRAIVVNGAPINGSAFKGAAIGVGYAAGTTAELDEMAEIAAQDLYDAMDHNIRMHVRYKNPDQVIEHKAGRPPEADGLRILCGDPEVPDLTGPQILALHLVGDNVQLGINVTNTANIDIRTTLAILIMRLAGANRAIVVNGALFNGNAYQGAAIGVGYAAGTTAELDEMAEIAAQNLYVAADHNLRMHVRYKNPEHPA